MKTVRPTHLRKSTRAIIVPRCKPRLFYGQGVPGVDLSKLAGKLIVVEGADGSGRSTQIANQVALKESWIIPPAVQVPVEPAAKPCKVEGAQVERLLVEQAMQFVASASDFNGALSGVRGRRQLTGPGEAFEVPPDIVFLCPPPARP